ncbi:hypothetical protein JL193_02260 [Polaribacter batillariae]|uniref:Uncharacterized protein n=1 Tax=Polaribacter batillariae TaxID=2808900 RepID=A0ABX7SXC4_9FLAO|nr:hypothetical protein [Polaribacter batillariae]QTD38151.1 hypothetical protein JL193_02260 [Polaribacter batillariae]
MDIYSQNTALKFKELVIEGGLASVNCILKDKKVLCGLVEHMVFLDMMVINLKPLKQI